MAKEDKLIRFVKNQNCSEQIKEEAILGIQQGIFTAQYEVSRYINEYPKYKDELAAKLAIKNRNDAMDKALDDFLHPKCPNCGSTSLKPLGNNQYRCEWCGAGIGKNGASAPYGQVMGSKATEALGLILVFLIFIVILIVYSLVTYFLLDCFNFTIFAVLAAMATISFLCSLSKMK